MKRHCYVGGREPKDDVIVDLNRVVSRLRILRMWKMHCTFVFDFEIRTFHNDLDCCRASLQTKIWHWKTHWSELLLACIVSLLSKSLSRSRPASRSYCPTSSTIFYGVCCNTIWLCQGSTYFYMNAFFFFVVAHYFDSQLKLPFKLCL